MILRNEILPGEEISLYSFAEKLGVSQTPIREVMPRLKSDNLIEQERNKRFKVTEITINDIHQVYEARKMLEPRIVKYSCKLINETSDIDAKVYSLKKKAENILSTLEHQKELEKDEYQLYLQIDEKLDEIISEPLNNYLLNKIFTLIGENSLRVRCYAEALTKHHQGVVKSATQEHLEIINLLLDGEKEKIADATKRHLAKAHQRTISALDQ